MIEQTTCTCHDIDIEAFRTACSAGARNVKACFKSVGCMPECGKCIPMVRKVLDEFAQQTLLAHPRRSS